MNKVFSKRLLAIILTFTMMLSMMLVFTISSGAEDNNTYILDASKLDTFAAGMMDNGDYVFAGTDNYFTVIYSEKAKVEGSEKTFSDGVFASKRISWGDKTYVGDEILNAVKIKTEGSAEIKIWWVCGGEITGSTNLRQVAIYDANGNIVAETAIPGENDTPSGTDGYKNDLFVSTLTVPVAGVYYIGNNGGSNYFYQIQVTDSKDGGAPAPRADWSTVEQPDIISSTDNGNGSIVVEVKAKVGHDGADELKVCLLDSTGENILVTKGSVIEKDTHRIVFNPKSSGTYGIYAYMTREGEEIKEVDSCEDVSFVYPLGTPTVASAASLGGGAVEVKWNEIHEAESYNIYVDGSKVATATGTSYKVTGLTIGTEYSFSVSAVRGNEEKKSGSISATATEKAQTAWGFTYYGPSTSADKNGYSGSINDDGYVTVYASGNGGKIQPEKNDGLSFYYTAVPTDYNFTLRAKVTINSWALSNGQEGFGLMAMDRLPDRDTDEYDSWNNSYLAGSTKIEYKYNPDTEQIIDNKVVDDTLKKFSMKCGIGSISRTGVTLENIEAMSKNQSEVIKEYFVSRYYPLDTTAANITNLSGTYNVLGNYTGTTPAGTFEERFLITEYIMEITKSNTGYLICYYNAETEELISQKQYYDPTALEHLDSEYVYVGFFAARNANITYSDVEFSTILCSEDAPREYPDTTYITPTVTVNSGNATTNPNYELIVDAGVVGHLTAYLGNTKIVDNVKIAMNGRYRSVIELDTYGENDIKLEFTPDPDQELGDFTELSSTATLYKTFTLTYNPGNYHVKTIYISPDVKPYTTTADGTRENPFDIFTALSNAYPGQTLILMEGTYKPGAAIKIQRGMDGTAENPIRLIADPEATTRPVIDFEGLWEGFTHAGDYWYFYGFDVTRSKDMQKGFQVSGSYNILDQIHAYENGNTGIQLSRLSGSDNFEDWPSYNLILNCTSYRNYDGGFEDADGFAAKLTIGDGNIFDGCIAYNNADDGWDLYAQAGTGAIGAVTIRNCIAYENGFVPGAGSKTGNGNGFKLGGESISGKHVLENSIAFNNLAKGIDSNSCPDVRVYNCVSFNNGNYNVALYTNNSDNTDFIVNGVISFRTTNKEIGENLRPKGNQSVESYMNATTYYWNADNGACMNTAGQVITADMFVSLEWNGWTRNDDGTINLGGFLELKSTAPANAQSCKLGGTASDPIVLEENEECTFSKAWYILDKDAHWHYCECGNKSHVEAHDFIWITDKPVVGMQTGLKHQECMTCGYKRAAITTYPDYENMVPDEPTDTPTTPDTPDTPTDGDVQEPVVELNFFQRIWQAILNFFRNLFGLNKE